MDLVEKELNWVLNAPVFFSEQAVDVAACQVPEDFVVALPGPVIFPNDFHFLSTADSQMLITDESQKIRCLNSLKDELRTMTSGRLGLKFEIFVHAILKSRYGLENVQTRVAVREKESAQKIKTWGEFDFLFLNGESQQLEHWESSIKFYLQVSNQPEWKWCWGPGVKDRLDLKGPKTFLQQLSLSSTSLGQQAIPREWSDRPLVKRVFAKGTIFYRWRPSVETFSERLLRIVPPQALSTDHLKSWWILPEEVSLLRQHFPRSRVALLPRMFWMAGLPLNMMQKDRLESWETFENQLSIRCGQASERNECLLMGVTSDEPDTELLTAGFVVTEQFMTALKNKNMSDIL